MSAEKTTDVARDPVTFLDVYHVSALSARMRCMSFPRESGCVVVVPDGFRRGNWSRYRIGGRINGR